MQVLADREKCCSSGMCVARAPEIFAQNETDGLVRVLQPVPPDSLRQKARAAELGCPVKAIRIIE